MSQWKTYPTTKFYISLFIYICVVMWDFKSLFIKFVFSLCWFLKVTLWHRKMLHKEHLIGCPGAKLILPKECFKFCKKLSCQKLSFWIIKNLVSIRPYPLETANSTNSRKSWNWPKTLGLIMDGWKLTDVSVLGNWGIWASLKVYC